MANDINLKVGMDGEKELKKGIADINRQLKTLDLELKKATAEFESNADSQEAMDAKSDILNRTLLEQQKKVAETQKVLAKMSEQYGENSREAQDWNDKLLRAQRDLAKTKNALSSTEKALDDLGNSINDTSSKTSGLEDVGQSIENIGKTAKSEVLMQAADHLAQVADKLIEVGQAAMDVSAQFQESQKNLQLNIGLTSDEAENLNSIVQNVFEQGVADSLDVATQSVQLLRKNFEDLNGTQLENLSNQLVGIVDVTGTDVPENIRAMQKLMSVFSLDAEKALDVIAAGYTNNLNLSDDFLDTINEYSVYFERAGYSSEEMLAVLKAGLQNGARNADIAADAIKELQIRLGDGSFEENIGSFSSSTQNLFKQWQNGKATVQDVANSISQDLQKMTPSEQQAALSLLSSQFEDLGVDASIALLGVTDGLNVATDAADKFAEQTPSEKWEGSLRSLQDALIPLGENLLEVLNPVVDFLTKITDAFTALPELIQTFITVFGGVIAVLGTLAPVILAVAAATTTLNVSLAPIIGVVAGVAAAIAAIVLVIQNWGTITEWFGETWDKVSAWCKETWDKVKKWFSDGAKSAADKVNEMREKVVNFFQKIIDGAKEKLGKIKSTVVNGFQSAIDWIKSLPTKALQWGKDFINGLVDGIKSMIGKVTGAVKDVAGKISSFLHFSVPDEGPLVDAPKWMPDMIDLMTKGIRQNESKVEDAARSLAEKMRNSLVMNANLTNVGGGRTSYTFSAPVYLDGKKIADNTQRYITSEQRGLQRARGHA
ncbi:MAG TPA: phage tail tape measure protein [Candidatus Scubalenecus merdavium]|uniref:Phage tail tape measure protein n=1 Tax=Candidatus Scybalenecus merdavium TaxID=2840939 RepID=A0A9D1MUE5_9FIRM|nr:phage tail tape measure protein [Candidatus Scubalenecus merdavium]